jgi:hypothetical protein
MATTIVSQNVNIAEIVFEAVESHIPDSEEVKAIRGLLKRVRPFVDSDLAWDMEMIINTALGQATEDGFKAGWEMRGRV